MAIGAIGIAAVLGMLHAIAATLEHAERATDLNRNVDRLKAEYANRARQIENGSPGATEVG